MELTVDRLKVLGETDIANLDKKIAAYKSSNDPTILNKDLESIQREIQNAQTKYNQLESEMAGIERRHAAAIQQRQQHNDRYKKMDDEQNKMTAEIDELFIQQQDYKSQIIAKKMEVDKCLSDLANEKQKLAEIVEDHKKADAEYQENLKVIRESIARVESEIKESRQRAYQRYLDYESAVKEVSLDAITSRNPVNANFAELVPDLLRVLARNMGNFLKVRELYTKMISDDNNTINHHPHIDVKQIKSKWDNYNSVLLIHYNICDEAKQLLQHKLDIMRKQEYSWVVVEPIYPEIEIANESEKEKKDLLIKKYNELKEKYIKYQQQYKIDIINITYKNYKENLIDTNSHNGGYMKCSKCCYTLPYIQKQYPNHTTTFDINLLNTCLSKSYKKLCQAVITDAKLNAIIQNTTYDELFDMLGSVFDIKVYNTYEFLLFIAFLGTGGKAHNLYDEF